MSVNPEFIMLNNRFVVPVMVATAFHALVFFGFSGSNPPPPGAGDPPSPNLPPVPPTVVETDLDDLNLVPDVRNEPKSQRRGSDDVFRPQQDEPPARPDGWELKTEPIHPRREGLTPVITPGIWGDPNGSGDEWTDRPVVSFKYLDNPPRTRSQVAPVYPGTAKASRLTGEVLVEFVVDEQGRVIRARVVRSSHPVFEEPTLKAVERWRFEPGRKTGQPVRFRMVAPVVFSLDT